MPLVEVVAGHHRRIRPAQRVDELRVALETDPQGVRAELGHCKHLSADLEHRRPGAEGERLLGSGEGEAAIAKLRRFHRSAPSVTLSTWLTRSAPPARPPHRPPTAWLRSPRSSR